MTINRRTFVKSLSCSAAGLALQSAKASDRHETRRPNVVFILPDEWRAQALGCMGNVDVQTPHLDRLASEGILLRNTLANTPLCCPARANILTGMYASQNGMVANDLRLRESLVTMGQLFSQAGYRTGYVGKWHLDGGPRLPGFVPPGPRRHGFEFWAANECNHDYFYNWYFRDADVPIIRTEYEPEYWFDLATEFLYEAQDQPFFLMIAPGAPHDPYIAPEKYEKMYDPAALRMRPNWEPNIGGAGRKQIALYYSAITAIDDQIGRLMRTLKELDLEDDTIVFFSSDHGNMLGSQGKLLKRNPWEESIRVPGILRYPHRVKAGQQSTILFSHVDIAPTLLSLCGINSPRTMQGTDLSSVILGRTQGGPTSAYFQIFVPSHAGGVLHAWRGVRTERYMYARTEAEPWVLYDLKDDPYEMTNLAHTDSASAIRIEMEAMLAQWMEKTKDSWSLDWSFPVEDGGGLYKYRTFYTVDEYLVWAREHPYLAPPGIL